MQHCYLKETKTKGKTSRKTSTKKTEKRQNVEIHLQNFLLETMPFIIGISATLGKIQNTNRNQLFP